MDGYWYGNYLGKFMNFLYNTSIHNNSNVFLVKQITNSKSLIMEILGLSLLTAIIIGLVAISLPVIALIDLARRPFGTSEKLFWIIIIIIIPILGSLVYLILGRHRRI